MSADFDISTAVCFVSLSPVFEVSVVFNHDISYHTFQNLVHVLNVIIRSNFGASTLVVCYWLMIVYHCKKKPTYLREMIPHLQLPVSLLFFSSSAFLYLRVLYTYWSEMS